MEVSLPHSEAARFHPQTEGCQARVDASLEAGKKVRCIEHASETSSIPSLIAAVPVSGASGFCNHTELQSRAFPAATDRLCPRTKLYGYRDHPARRLLVRRKPERYRGIQGSSV